MIVEVLTWVVALGLVAANLAFWAWVIRRGEDRFRLAVESHFDVTIKRGMRGHWTVVSNRSAITNFFLELLQLVFFLGAFVVWAAGMLGGVGLLALVQRLG